MRASGLFKRVVALTFAAVFAAGSARADSPRYDVYLLAGQSNMCGRGPLPATAYDLTNVQIWNGNAWEQAVEPFFHDLSTSGAGLAASFARTMADAEPGVVVRLVPAALGDTGMSRWIPEGDLYQAAVTMTRAAVANGGGTLKGILWHQGEADSGSTANAQNYAANFTRMVNQFRTDLGNVASDPVIPVVAGELGRYFGDPGNTYCTYWQTVNNQLRTVAKTLDNVYLISSEGLTPKDDKIHFDTPSLRTLGVRYSVAFLDPGSLPVLEPPAPPSPPESDPSKNVLTLDYVQDGLVAQWDGLENAGRFRHSDAITVWKDLVGGSEITLASDKSLVGANFVQVLKSKEIAGSCPELGLDRPKTIEICAHCVEMNSNPDSYVFMNNGHKYIGVSRGVSSGYRFTYDNGANTRIYKKGISTVDTSAIHTFSCGYPGTTLSLGYDGQYVTLPAGNERTASAKRSCLEAFTLGKEDPTSPRLASYEYYSLRIYSRLLTPGEIRQNRWIDQLRYEGARVEDLLPEGVWLLADGTFQYQVNVDAHGAGVRFGGSAEAFAEGEHTWWKPLPSATIEAEPKSGWLYGWVGAPQAGASWTDGGATMTWDIDGAVSLYLDAFEPSASVRHIAPGAVEELASMQGVKSLHVGALQGETDAAVCRIGGQVEVTAENGGYAIVENRGSTLRKTTFTLLNGGTLKLLADAEFHDLEMPDAADKLDLNGFKLSLRSPTHQNTGWTGQVTDSSADKTGRIEWVRAGFMLMIK